MPNNRIGSVRITRNACGHVIQTIIIMCIIYTRVKITNTEKKRRAEALLQNLKCYA